MDNFFKNAVSVYHDPDLMYPEDSPYNPSIKYPEYFLDGINSNKNDVYDAVRKSFILLGLDKDNFEKPNWNPFKLIVKPGYTVVIKPNFVVSRHSENKELYSIITHPSIIRVIVDYVYIALRGQGRIIIADSPQMDCNFNELLERTKLKSIKELYKRKLNFDLEIYDLRNFWLDKKGENEAYSSNRHELSGDPSGSVSINLGKKSLFYNVSDYEKYFCFKPHSGWKSHIEI